MPVPYPACAFTILALRDSLRLGSFSSTCSGSSDPCFDSRTVEMLQDLSGEIHVSRVKPLPKFSDISHILRGEEPSLVLALGYLFGRPSLTDGSWA